MQPAEQTISLPRTSFFLGSGSIVIFILEVAALVYGLSDGSFMYVVPLILSPFLGIAGVIVGIIALKRKIQPRGLAMLGIVCGCICVALCTGFLIYIYALVAGLQGVA